MSYHSAGDVMKKCNLALALAAAFAAAPALGQATVDQKLQILQQEIEDLKAQAGRAAPSTQQPPAPDSQDYSSPPGRTLPRGSAGREYTAFGSGALQQRC